jgi:hypothetical protein
MEGCGLPDNTGASITRDSRARRLRAAVLAFIATRTAVPCSQLPMESCFRIAPAFRARARKVT